MSTEKNAYLNLCEHFQKLSNLENARAILQWDEAVMMPQGSSDSRNASLAELAGLIQSLTIEPRVGDWLKELDGTAEGLGLWEHANLREMRRLYKEATAVPPELLKRLVLAKMTCEQKWRTLRAQNDWAGFQPYLQDVLDLTREMLEHVAKVRGLSLYDAALSLYSPGLSTSVIEKLFSELKGFLPQTVQKIVAKQKTESRLDPIGPFPVEAQRNLGLALMRSLGFDFERGRLDVSHHPFCGGTSRDVRLTTRYDEESFMSALMGILHETGHAMYEQNLPSAWNGQPVGHAAGMAIHESQSLLFEMQICRSPEFMAFAAPLIREHLGPFTKNPESLELDNLVRLVTRVEPGFIRVDADEATYPAHVILRFEIERDLLERRLSLADLPQVWNEKMEAYLGLRTVGNDRDGCMQDVHWPSGAFGYFPAYTFGAVIAAQLFASAKAQHPEIPAEIARGNFSTIQSWARENIWHRGALLTTMDLVEKGTGQALSAQHFRRHLEDRYLELRAEKGQRS